jgi:hypothetical protein
MPGESFCANISRYDSRAQGMRGDMLKRRRLISFAAPSAGLVAAVVIWSQLVAEHRRDIADNLSPAPSSPGSAGERRVPAARAPSSHPFRPAPRAL